MPHKVLDFAHSVAARVLRPGDVSVDATVGNGHDTRFLARSVGAHGRVWGFDVQSRAIRRTRARVHDVPAHVTLVRASHEFLADYVREPVRVALFNLGYLPGSSRRITTRPDSTVRALRALWPLMLPGGRIVMVLYRGHPGGREEADAVLQWCASVEGATAVRFGFGARSGAPPEVLVVARRP